MKRTHRLLPPLGKAGLLGITEKQFGNIIISWGKAEAPKKPTTITVLDL